MIDTAIKRGRMGEGSVSQKRLLSIIVPVYNEEEYVEASILRALNAPLPE